MANDTYASLISQVRRMSEYRHILHIYILIPYLEIMANYMYASLILQMRKYIFSIVYSRIEYGTISDILLTVAAAEVP